MVVHSSMCNPWFYPFFGTVAMGAGQIFGPKLYPVMSNAGILIFVITLLALMAEVDKDIVETHNVANFLVQVGQIGDEISVTPHPRAVPSVRQAYIDQPNNTSAFRRFSRKSFRDEERIRGTVVDTSKQSSNVNKSVHSVSTDITEPTSNVKKSSAPPNGRKSASIRSSLSAEDAQPETIHEEEDTTLDPNNGADTTEQSGSNDANLELPENDADQTDAQRTDDNAVDVSVEETKSIEEPTSPLTSKSIMKGMLDDVQVLIDEELGEADEISSSEADAEDKPPPDSSRSS